MDGWGYGLAWVGVWERALVGCKGRYPEVGNHMGGSWQPEAGDCSTLQQSDLCVWVFHHHTGARC